MIKSIFRLIWKRKSRGLLIIIEIFISLLLLFALSSMIINNILHYIEPIGFNYNNVWVIAIDFNQEKSDSAYVSQQLNLLINNIKSLPEVIDVSDCSSNIPYFFGGRSTTIHYDEKRIPTDWIDSDTHYSNVLGLKLSEGRWYNADDIGQKQIPIVINKKLNNELFGTKSGIGKIIHGDKYKIVGIVNDFKIKGEFSNGSSLYFEMLKPYQTENTLLIKTRSTAGVSFEEHLVDLSSSTAKDWTIKVSKLTDHRLSSFKITWIPIIVFSTICAFLIINILLGLFGVLLNNINSRKPEIGLRRSMGATTPNIYIQFIGEMLLLTTIGILPALIITVQFPILDAFNVESIVYILAIIFSMLIIYLMVFISSFIPSRYAAKVHPADALHNE